MSKRKLTEINTGINSDIVFKRVKSSPKIPQSSAIVEYFSGLPNDVHSLIASNILKVFDFN